MSRHPRPKLRRGRVDGAGRRLCCYCGALVGARRRYWCSAACVERYGIARGNQSVARQYLQRTQRGVCQLCGQACGAYLTNLGWRRVAWEADHIVPLVEGGARTPENLRTLCCMCHRHETGKLRTRLAAKRREAAKWREEAKRREADP